MPEKSAAPSNAEFMPSAFNSFTRSKLLVVVKRGSQTDVLCELRSSNFASQTRRFSGVNFCSKPGRSSGASSGMYPRRLGSNITMDKSLPA
jgi:hypothetical protein